MFGWIVVVVIIVIVVVIIAVILIVWLREKGFCEPKRENGLEKKQKENCYLLTRYVPYCQVSSSNQQKVPYKKVYQL